MAQHEDEIDFGFSNVNTSQKAGLVRGVFDSVANNYDLMNDAMSVGIHRVWKKILLDRINPRPGQTLLDVAGGTGDVAVGFLARAQERELLQTKMPELNTPATAVIFDINHAMLKAGQTRSKNQKSKDYPFNKQLTRVCGDAECLPLPTNSVHAYTISLGIRNVTDRDAALREAYRVIKPGGRFICLELSHMITESLQKLYDQYSFNVIPWLGEKIVNDRASYQYLVESIRRFPSQDMFAEQIKRAGFHRVKYENLSGGVAALHMGWKI